MSARRTKAKRHEAFRAYCRRELARRERVPPLVLVEAPADAWSAFGELLRQVAEAFRAFMRQFLETLRAGW